VNEVMSVAGRENMDSALNSRAGAAINHAARKHFTWSVGKSGNIFVRDPRLEIIATLIQAVWPRV
jgi:hypothetical protein